MEAVQKKKKKKKRERESDGGDYPIIKRDKNGSKRGGRNGSKNKYKSNNFFQPVFIWISSSVVTTILNISSTIWVIHVDYIA